MRPEGLPRKVGRTSACDQQKPARLTTMLRGKPPQLSSSRGSKGGTTAAPQARAAALRQCLGTVRASHIAHVTARYTTSQRGTVCARAQAPDAPVAEVAPQPGTTPAFDINERVEFLRVDLQNLFNDKGLDVSAYDQEVAFEDPLTRYSSLDGYLFNVQFLKRVFDPVLEVHDIRALTPLSIVSRWTMTMDFTPTKVLPLLSNFWQPKLIFSGTSVYGFNPSNGKINRHVDTWDSLSVDQQRFFSPAAFADFFRQMLATYTIPDLEQPEYTVLRRTGDYQVRKYQPYLVAETTMAGGSVSSEYNPASGVGNRSFGTLARYIFGGNVAQEKMEMTTPVISDTTGAMQFVISPSAHKDLSSVPAPVTGLPVTPKREPGGVFAAATFGGIADEGSAERAAQKLMACLDRDGVLYDKQAGWRLARYNDPGTLPPFRRNEVLVPLREPYDLWRPGEVDAVRRNAGV